MDLREAAAASEPEPEPRPGRSKPKDFWTRAAERGWHGAGFEAPPGFEERWGQTPKGDGKDPRWRKPEDEKRRWNAAYEAARRRGLDGEAEANGGKPRRPPQQPKSNRRMNPFQHARSLLRETSLPLSEIADITRLSIYQVVGLKLKMRDEPYVGRRARA